MEDDFGDIEDDSEEAVKKRKLQKEVRERVLVKVLVTGRPVFKNMHLLSLLIYCIIFHFSE